MKLIFDRHPGEPERYTVLFPTNDEHGKRNVCGTATRINGNAWDFVPHFKSLPPGVEDVTIRLHAADADGLRVVLSERLTRVLSGDAMAGRLTDELAETYTVVMLNNMNNLCAKLGTMAGYSNGLSHAVAQLVTEDMTPAQEAEFMALFVAQVAKRAEAMRAHQEFDQTAQAAIKQLFKTAREALAAMDEARDDDTPPDNPETKH